MRIGSTTIDRGVQFRPAASPPVGAYSDTPPVECVFIHVHVVRPGRDWLRWMVDGLQVAARAANGLADTRQVRPSKQKRTNTTGKLLAHTMHGTDARQRLPRWNEMLHPINGDRCDDVSICAHPMAFLLYRLNSPSSHRLPSQVDVRVLLHRSSHTHTSSRVSSPSYLLLVSASCGRVVVRTCVNEKI
jgi:hypothetical protein